MLVRPGLTNCRLWNGPQCRVEACVRRAVESDERGRGGVNGNRCSR